jgi:predicted phage-related endonuclease
MNTKVVSNSNIKVVPLDRSKGIGGSDANRIMRGDWHKLWLEKTGRQVPEDLSKNLAVQIGVITEPVNIRFFEYEKNFKVISNAGELRQQDQFMFASYDGVVMNSDNGSVAETKVPLPIECKHTNSNNTMDNCVQNYMPQLQHYLMVSKAPYIYLSVIFGNNRYETCKVDADKTYQKKLYEIEKSFWQYVQEDKEPENLDITDLPKLAGKIKVNDMITIDFDKTGNNEFLSHASRWGETKPVADEHKALGTILKGFIPDDCRKATGGNVLITRTKAGYLTIKQNQRRYNNG